nr:MAG TPA: hypothetical protein [Caudoviricetes sp.]
MRENPFRASTHAVNGFFMDNMVNAVKRFKIT